MNYNKSGLMVLLASVFFSFVWFAYLIFFSPEMELAKLDPTELKGFSGEGVDPSGKTSPDIHAEKPWIFRETMVKQGGKVYQIYCASCHGKTGLGDGLASVGLKPPPRSFVEGDWKQGGDSISLYKTLAQGIEGSSMVSFSYLSVEDRWALVHYIRSITENKVKDDMEKLEEFAKTAK